MEGQKVKNLSAKHTSLKIQVLETSTIQRNFL